MNPLQALESHGQSVWFDHIQRSLIWTGQLHRMVAEDGLRGVTSNPASYEQAMGDSADYGPALAALVADGLGAHEAYEQLAVDDLRWACDVLQPVYYETDGRDGFCCLGVSPHAADDPMETLDEANRLWELIGRDNLMIKIPATQAGLSVLPELIVQGINVNMTLLFSVQRYRQVHAAYVRGIEELVRAGGDPSSVASVASFLVSRIDSMVDAEIDARLASAAGDQRTTLASLRGQTAIASAKLAYQAYRETVGSERWLALAAEGARPQRLLWASTSPKDPTFRDVRYVESLVGPDTVTTLPASTYAAFQDHGDVTSTLTSGLDRAEATLHDLAAVGIQVAEVAQGLEEEGVRAYAEAHDRLMAAIQEARVMIMGDAQPAMDLSLGVHEDAVEARTTDLDELGFIRRLWGRDGSLFTDEGTDAEPAMGWLDIVEVMGPYTEHLTQFQARLEAEEVESVVLMGMGGSSLAADALIRTFGQLDGSPEVLVLDSTVPAQIRAVEAEITPEETVFITASKSGTTTEPLALHAYFRGVLPSPSRFVAITDPESPLEEMALEDDAPTVFHGDPDVAGGYSALSPFGMVPAAAMGLDVDELLDRAQLMVASCSESVPAYDNPGVLLGAALGELARVGRNKLTLVLSPGIEGFGPWIQQLIAESTGKDGQGIVPITHEALAAPDRYRNDRVFAYIALEDDDDDARSEVLDRLDALHAEGHPVLTFTLSDPRDLVQEMFRWQVAAVTASHVLGVNPFDQTDVQPARAATAELLAKHERDDRPPVAPATEAIAEDEGLVIHADPTNASALPTGATVQDILHAHLGRAQPGDYVALQAFVEMNELHDATLARIQATVRDRYRVATLAEYGPRYLHTTGQLHKAGPNQGIFIQLTCDDPEDLAIPDRPYSFGVLKAAQQAGDLVALTARQRRVIRVHLGADPTAGLQTIARMLTPR